MQLSKKHEKAWKHMKIHEKHSPLPQETSLGCELKIIETYAARTTSLLNYYHVCVAMLTTSQSIVYLPYMILYGVGLHCILREINGGQ